MLLFTLALLGATAAAAPTDGILQQFDNSTLSKDVSAGTVTQAELDNMAYYAQYAAASYCDTRIPEGDMVTCVREKDSCPKVTADKSTVIAYLGTESSSTDMQGMASFNPQTNTIIVAFRGTASPSNAFVDLQFGMTDCASAMSETFIKALESAGHSKDQCEMHSGFGDAWKSVKTKTLQTVQSALAAHNDAANAAKITGFEGDQGAPGSQPTESKSADAPKLVLTGHSLGGAVASLAAAELRAFGVPCELYTYGMPRVGSQVLAEFLTKQKPAGPNGINNYRVTHGHDIVPQIPPQKTWFDDKIQMIDSSTIEGWGMITRREQESAGSTGRAKLVSREFLNYFHTSPEFWLEGDGTSTSEGFVSYTPSDVKVCEGHSNYACNANITSSIPVHLIDLAAHTTYFNAPMDDCHKGPIDTIKGAIKDAGDMISNAYLPLDGDMSDYAAELARVMAFIS